VQWKKKICHEGKPVAVREKLFKILTIAHKQCQHGGRDKTSAQVRRIYSWCVSGRVLQLMFSKRTLLAVIDIARRELFMELALTVFLFS
jgi:hypothetical protein